MNAVAIREQRNKMMKIAACFALLMSMTGNVLAQQFMLRDAEYRYNEPIRYTENHYIPLMLGGGCNVFQIVMTVIEGNVRFFYNETPSIEAFYEGSTAQAYPDVLNKESGMFAYALYSDNPLKGFGFVSADEKPAAATVFGYCFSIYTDAFSAFLDINGVWHGAPE